MEINKYEKHRLRCAQCGFTFTKKNVLLSEYLKPVIDEYENVFCNMDCYHRFVEGDVRELDDYDWAINDINKEAKHGRNTLQTTDKRTGYVGESNR